ncbi:HET-s/LopB domain protein [Aspergillus ellipticus CBS 707.79]|uniref:HET-s/LopB domain protein n=1 Tax=Aspergillus ellipticus CBS 707.79 TaxID=1448320 RepID=A0A319DEK1_9EURO|nr:HET-s/LopB domain protein [Aspergillus ellipticus CBS 707.79]
MSVLRHHGGAYLQRRLTKMYTDTKTSCESVTTATIAVDDPELVMLHRSFKTQRDRLLAWGLDWSDASAAQPNDIDESLTQAGYSDVVESVMSSIQVLLNEAERIQHGGASDLPPKGGASDSPKGSLTNLPVKSHWTSEEISRSKTLLADLEACIDTLYDLSRSRRNMSASMTAGGQSATKGRSRPGDYSILDSKAYHGASFDGMQTYPTQQSPFDIAPSPTRNAPHQGKSAKMGKFSLTLKTYVIDRSALQLSGSLQDNDPPPYEQVAASTNSRAIGRMRTSASPFLHGTKDSTATILVEYTPMMLEASGAAPTPETKRLDHVQQALEQLVQNARVSHLGLLKFLGYYIDMPNSRYAFVYQMPVDYFPFLLNPSDLLNGLKPKPLVSLFQAGDDYHIPNLETRFRLAYDLVMAVLQLRSQNLVHRNINSSNVLIFPGSTNSNSNEVGLTENLRRPYLTSFAQFSGNGPSPEPLSSSMYRHPDDKRSMEDDAAWAYDLYSLGLVLLEIGLWNPISRIWKMKYTNSMFKQRIENVYLQKLGPKCGSAYLHVVQLCLDAPNFHLSTQPFDDLNLRVPQSFHYPVLDLSAPDGIFSFSMNFLYTMSKIIWSCCRIDMFSAPAAEELDDCLPLALVPGLEPAAMKEPVREYKPAPEPVRSFPEPFASIPTPEMKLLRDKIGMDDRRVRKRTCKKLSNVEIPQDHLNKWNFQMLPRLRKLLQKILKDSAESCSVTLMMTGDTVDNAKTTVCVTCASAKKVRAALKKYFVLDSEDWDLLVLRGDVQRSKVPRKKRRRPAMTEGQGSGAPPFVQNDPNPCYEPRPLCGASIGAFMNDEHLPPVSYGGAILVDGMPYGMTVHHMLESPSDEEDADDQDTSGPLRSAGNWPRQAPVPPQNPEYIYSWRDEGQSDLSSDPDLEFEVSEDEDGDDVSLSPSLDGNFDDSYLSEGYSSDEDGGNADDAYADDAASIGDTPGIDPEDEPPLFVTQPAIDDVDENFFPCPEDRDDEHLASHSFGYVHASSGVRRWTRKGLLHEIDWALIKINDDRMDVRNIVYDKTSLTRPDPYRQRRGEPARMPQAETIYLNNVARLEDLGGIRVHCCGRTSGLQTGQISRAMTLVKLHGRQTFSTSFCVEGNFGVPGDSGAWVFEKSSGRVCGHVLAWSDKTHTAYIAPMEILLEDIARTLNASFVALPGSPDESSRAYSMHPRPSPTMDPHYQNPRYHTPRPLRGHVPVEINQLRIDDPVHTSRGLREVSTPYRGLPPILTPPRSLERQLA